MSKERLIIFDTTLRDGEQSPGASMTREEKVRIAKMLEKMRVDVIEAGFAIASPGDFESVKSIADTIMDSTVCSLSRALDADIDRAGDCCGPYWSVDMACWAEVAAGHRCAGWGSFGMCGWFYHRC